MERKEQVRIGLKFQEYEQNPAIAQKTKISFSRGRVNKELELRQHAIRKRGNHFLKNPIPCD